MGIIHVRRIAASGPFTPGDFRIGNVFRRTLSVLLRNISKFSLVTGIAVLPSLLIPQVAVANAGNPSLVLPLVGAAVFLMLVLSLLSQTIVFYGAFQDVRGRPVNLSDGLKVGLGRLFPLVGLGIVVFFALIGLAIIPSVTPPRLSSFPS
ncbi:MAG TPA: hypothetical protein VGI22_12755 [Xanthobacteraceae bacterium]